MTVTNRYKEWHTKQMEDPDYRDAYDDLEIAFQVARLRMLKGVTQAQLAEMVGTRQSSIARLESGTTMPRLSFLHKVVNALGGRLVLNILSEDEMRNEKIFPPTSEDGDNSYFVVPQKIRTYVVDVGLNSDTSDLREEVFEYA